MTVLLGLTASVLVGIGVYLLLQRRLSRIIIGLGLLGHGANLLLLLSGDGGLPAFAGSTEASAFADPLPQALILTAIVITFGVTAFLLALAYRGARESERARLEQQSSVEVTSSYRLALFTRRAAP